MSDLIDRQAAIDALNDEFTIIGKTNAIVVQDYIRRVNNRLRDLPSAQPDLDEWCTDCKEYDHERHCCPRFNRVIRNALKDAQPERKKGKWIYDDESYAGGNPYGHYECDKCGEYVPHKTNYCPQCGAKMSNDSNTLETR